jgi:RNA polymerase primary sigma factor
LSRQEEDRYARQIRFGKILQDFDSTLFPDLGNLTEVQRQVYIETGYKAQHKLLLANTGLVIEQAQKYSKFGLPFMDLIQEGNLGLYKAIDKYDYRKNVPFYAHAKWWVRSSISSFMRKNLPRMPDDDNPELILEIIPYISPPSISDDDYETAQDLVAFYINQLPENQQQVLTLQYGLNGGELLTPTDIIQQTGISKATFFRYRSAAFDFLRQQQPLFDYYEELINA